MPLAWVPPDEGSEKTDALCDRLLHERVVPVVWPLEVGNALLMAVRRGRITDKDMRRLADQLGSLPIDIDQDSTKRVLRDVLALASRLELTTYDAAYLELAIRLTLPLATLEKQLRAACRAAKVEVL